MDKALVHMTCFWELSIIHSSLMVPYLEEKFMLEHSESSLRKLGVFLKDCGWGDVLMFVVSLNLAITWM